MALAIKDLHKTSRVSENVEKAKVEEIGMNIASHLDTSLGIDSCPHARGKNTKEDTTSKILEVTGLPIRSHYIKKSYLAVGNLRARPANNVEEEAPVAVVLPTIDLVGKRLENTGTESSDEGKKDCRVTWTILDEERSKDLERAHLATADLAMIMLKSRDETNDVYADL